MLVQSLDCRKREDHQLVKALAQPGVHPAFSGAAQLPSTPTCLQASGSDIPNHTQIAFAYASAEQEAALNALKDFDEEKILTYLEILQSIETGSSGIQFRSGNGVFLSEQLDALTTLRDCHLSNVAIWLQFIRLTGK